MRMPGRRALQSRVSNLTSPAPNLKPLASDMQLLAEYSSQQIMLVVGICIFVFAIMMRTRRQFKQSTPTRKPSMAPRIVTGSATCDIPTASKSRSTNPLANWESMEVEMHDLARQLKGEIDSKLTALSQLVRLADDATSQLNAAIERAESLGLLEASQSAIGFVKSDDVSNAVATSSNTRENDSRSERFSTNPRAMRRTMPGTLYSGRLSLPQTVEDDPRFERVFALADAGFSPTRIAAQIGAQIGEVELILSLRAKTTEKSELVSGQ